MCLESLFYWMESLAIYNISFLTIFIAFMLYLMFELYQPFVTLHWTYIDKFLYELLWWWWWISRWVQNSVYNQDQLLVLWNIIYYRKSSSSCWKVINVERNKAINYIMNSSFLFIQNIIYTLLWLCLYCMYCTYVYRKKVISYKRVCIKFGRVDK